MTTPLVRSVATWCGSLAIVLGVLLVPADGWADRDAAEKAKQKKEEARARKRPSLERFRVLLEEARRTGKTASFDARKFREALAREHFEAVAKQICHAGTDRHVVCYELDKMFEDLSDSDQSLLNLGLNDLTEAVGGTASSDTLLACGRGALGGISDLIPMDTSSGKTPGGFKGSSPKGALATSMANRCRETQLAGIHNGLGALASGDPAYTGAVQKAVASMDAAMAQCDDTKMGLVSNPGSAQGSSPAPVNPPAPKADNKNADKQEDKKKDGAKDEANVVQQAGKAAVFLINAVSGIIGSGEALNEVATAAKGARAKGVASLILSGVATAATAAGLVTDAQAVEDIGNLADVAGGVLELATMEVSTSAAVGAAGLGFEVVGPVAAAFSISYGGVRLANTATGGLVDKAAVEFVGVHSDWAFSAANGTPYRPSEDGKPSCRALQDRWQKFRDRCNSAGNNWQTYDCMIFVARANGCADPALINPGPEGDYVCRAKDRDGSQGSALTCAQKKKLGGMLTIPNGQARECPSSGQNLGPALRELIRTELCKRVTPNPDGAGNCEVGARKR